MQISLWPQQIWFEEERLLNTDEKVSAKRRCVLP